MIDRISVIIACIKLLFPAKPAGLASGGPYIKRMHLFIYVFIYLFIYVYIHIFSNKYYYVN